MPFASKKQWAWAFATGQDFARRWATETPGGNGARFRRLPTRKRRTKALDVEALVQQALTAYKANYSARAGQVIAGRLKRGGDGKFTSEGSAPPAPSKTTRRSSARRSTTARKPKTTDAQKQAERDRTKQQREQQRQQEQTANRERIGRELGLQEDARGTLDELMRSGVVADDGGLERMGLAEKTADGQYRLTAAGRSLVTAMSSGDAGRAREIASRAGDTKATRDQAATDRAAKETERATKRQEREAAQAKRRAEVEQRRNEREARKQGGGGGGGKATEAQKQQQRAQTADATAPRVGLTPTSVANLRSAAEGTTLTDDGTAHQLRSLGLIDTDGVATDQGRRLLTALERGDVRQAQAALQDARARLAREQRRQKADPDTSHLAVFKAADGQWWWVARSSTAFRDRDGEIVSTTALKAAVAQMRQSGQYGPLRFWHQPGIDVGDTRGAAVVGHTLVEWGTFKSAGCAALVRPDDQISLAFRYAPQHRDADRTFHAIQIFERSICPAGTARNPMTRIAAGPGGSHDQV